MALLYMLMASTCFVSMAAMVKVLGDSLPLPVLMLLRSTVALPVLLSFLLLQKKPLLTRAPLALGMRTLFGALAMYCFYYALTHMELANCVFITRTQPLLIALLAPCIVGESPPRVVWIAIVTGMLCVGLIMQPGMEWNLAAFAAFGGAVSSAFAHLFIRKLGHSDDPGVIVFNFTSLLALLSLLLSWRIFVWPDTRQWWIILAVALLASSGQYLLTKAYQLDQAPIVASSSYASVVLSILYGYVFWGEVPEAQSVFGGLLIVGGGLTLYIFRQGKSTPLHPKQ